MQRLRGQRAKNRGATSHRIIKPPCCDRAQRIRADCQRSDMNIEQNWNEGTCRQKSGCSWQWLIEIYVQDAQTQFVFALLETVRKATISVLLELKIAEPPVTTFTAIDTRTIRQKNDQSLIYSQKLKNYSEFDQIGQFASAIFMVFSQRHSNTCPHLSSVEETNLGSQCSQFMYIGLYLQLAFHFSINRARSRQTLRISRYQEHQNILPTNHLNKPSCLQCLLSVPRITACSHASLRIRWSVDSNFPRWLQRLPWFGARATCIC